MYPEDLVSEEVGTSYVGYLDSILLNNTTGSGVVIYFTSAEPQMTLNTDKNGACFTYNSFS